MKNNDILIGIRDSLDINRPDMVEIFKCGEIEITEEDVLKMLMKPKDDETDINGEYIECDYITLESFLNGLIIFKRGKKEKKEGQPEKTPLAITSGKSVNNVMLKKLKIALSFSSEDILELFELADATLTKGELTCFFRKEGHKHYKRCNDKHANNFLKGLAIKNRK